MLPDHCPAHRLDLRESRIEAIRGAEGRRQKAVPIRQEQKQKHRQQQRPWLHRAPRRR